ncbi:MAG: SufE family protein [Muribaculaceae bacterium]|nr:SufE family protein [Muribaculaceae bacterium]
MTIEERQQEIIGEFADVEDWMDRYGMIIDMGNALPPLDEQLKTPSNIIEGCQSRVWLAAEETPDGRIHYSADSDALIVKGIISLLVDVVNDHTPDEILNADLHFINDIGLAEHLSPTRANGLTAMLKQMKMYALAFKTRAEKKAN